MKIRTYIISVLATAPLAAASSQPVSQGVNVEQTAPGSKPGAELIERFDGLGAGLSVVAAMRNPSDNSLAVGPDHIMQTVNSQIAVFSKKGTRYDTTGRVLYGPIATNSVFAGFGGVCEARPNGDAVVRYDQLAGRWLIVMPIFRRAVVRRANEPVDLRVPAVPGEAARPVRLRSLARPLRSVRRRLCHRLCQEAGALPTSRASASRGAGRVIPRVS